MSTHFVVINDLLGLKLPKNVKVGVPCERDSRDKVTFSWLLIFKREGKGKKGDARVNLADLCPSSVYEAHSPGK